MFVFTRVIELVFVESCDTIDRPILWDFKQLDRTGWNNLSLRPATVQRLDLADCLLPGPSVSVVKHFRGKIPSAGARVILLTGSYIRFDNVNQFRCDDRRLLSFARLFSLRRLLSRFARYRAGDAGEKDRDQRQGNRSASGNPCRLVIGAGWIYYSVSGMHGSTCVCRRPWRKTSQYIPTLQPVQWDEDASREGFRPCKLLPKQLATVELLIRPGRMRGSGLTFQ